MSTALRDIDVNILLSVVEHVFLPPKLPQQGPTEENERDTNVALCHILIQAAQAFSQSLSPSQQLLWAHTTKTMSSIYGAAKRPRVEKELKHALSDLAVGDVFVMHVRAQNAAVLIRILVDHVQFEIFEVCPPTSSVTSTSGKLLCSYPGPALQISSDIFSNECFLQELASFLVQMDVDELDSGATTHKAGSIVREVRDSAHPKYISQLLVGILRGFGSLPASVDRITKRIRDEVLWKDAYKPWRRSPLWLVIRVALQTSLDCDVYKTFILFFHAHLLQSCVKRGFPSEILYLMRVKVALRLSKLGPAVSDHVYQAVYDAATETETLLQQRWSDFQASQSISPPWHPDKLDVVRDTEITLKNSFSYIENALSSKPLSYPHKKFKPAHSRRLVEIVNFTCFSDGRLKAAVRSDKRSALADFELAVERHLDSWVDSSQHDDDSSDVIASCVEQYYANAKEIYGGSPEDNSVMLLTIIDLWMALDKLTVQQCPLMACYSPEIPRDFLHPLLLHRSGSLKRALLIERYISRRHEEASCGTSIFSDNATDSSFAVRYFGGSSKLKQLHADINHHAEQQREAKRAELSALNEEWHSLKDEASGLTHTYVDDDDSEGEGNLVHAHYCQKCGKERAADRLKIDVFEWPLPQSTAQAQLVVFELSPPRAFSVWRGITYKILCDIGMPPSASTGNNADRPKLLLDAFSGLKRWALRHEYHRITLGSTTKSFRDQTHYKKVRIPADEHHVFVNNGLSFKIHDRKTGCWAAQPFRGTTIAKFCVPPIPLPSPYAEFHSFVTGTYHTSNEVIAAQGDCLSELSSHEFLAFSGLRSGPRLQWLNITRELSSPSLSFRREEVHTLITQAAWHLGPLSDDVREWHTDLDVPSFGRTLLHELEHLLGRIEFNWLEEVTIRSIGMSDSTLFRLSDGALVLLSLALITSRFLSAAPDQDICQRAYALLRKVRNTAYNWISELDSKLFQTEDEKARNNLGWRLCTLAATCLSTYDVCLEHVSGVLSGASDIAIAVRCAVIVNDNTPSVIRGDDSHYLSRLLNRHSRLLHFLEPFFREAVRTCPSGFDQALTSLWPGFRRQSSSNWHVLSDPNSRWVSCIAEGGQEIHYNLLSGQLLIGGNPLGRLPQEIIQHPTYASVLGTRVLDVVPADLPGMEFMTQSNVSGYQVFFSLHDGDLTIQARRLGDSQCLQLIPRAVFVNDFPEVFVDGCVHWLYLGTGKVELRPVESTWIPDPSNWQLITLTDKSRSACRKISGDGAAPVELIDIRSPTFQMISGLLSALESPEHITITRTKQVLEASLPRLHLVFFVNGDSELECRSMPGYVIDKLQSCGTMFGLKNQLVLCPGRGSSKEMPRRVIIPQGDIGFSLKGEFSTVSIKTGTRRPVHWHEYTIDADLGRLTGNVSLQSKLYQCYLHALTSHCLPDALLGHTGTEESLQILQSAALLSFQRLGEGEAKLLQLISDLTPRREYYPLHRRSMVTVKWKNLPILSQHHDFHSSVLPILDYAQAMEALHAEHVVFKVPRQDASLLERVAFHNRVYYPHNLQTLRHSSTSIPKDVAYESRGAAECGSSELAAYQTSWSVWNDKPCFSRNGFNLWDKMKSWGSVGTADATISLLHSWGSVGNTTTSLRYSRYWLSLNAAKDWFRIYGNCKEVLRSLNDPRDWKIRLAFSLSAASFSGTKYANVIPLILIFATDARFRRLEFPTSFYYDLSDGTDPEHGRLTDLMRQFALPMEDTPAQFVEVRATSSKKIAKAQKREYNSSINEMTSDAAQRIVDRWPKRRFNLSHQWFENQRCKECVGEYLESVSRNMNLRGYIYHIQSIIDGYNVTIPPDTSYVFSPRFVARSPKATSPSLRELLMSRADFTRSPSSGHFDCAVPSAVTIGAQTNPPPTREDNLSLLIHEFRDSQESLLRLYGDNLNKSYCDLVEKAGPFPVHRSVPSQQDLLRYRDLCSEQKNAIFYELSEALAPSQRQEHVLHVSGLWPRITSRSILRELSRDRVHTLNEQWKRAITGYAVAFLTYQQSQRLVELASRRRDEEFLREADTVCEDVAAACSPDWLLIQIDANFLARPLQLAIAREMISPTCKRSASLQLNMGEGKSSVIVPLVAATLADGSNLARVVTLKPLSNQMFQLLFSRLSDLADRRIFYVPFSRDLPMSPSVVQSIHTLYRRCAEEGGVLVVQPEHLLSQKLMCIDTLLTSQDDHDKLAIARPLKELQRWLAKVSRDILDESDEILHVRYQLVYTSGPQKLVEDHPNRWSTTQQVLSRLRAHAASLHDNFPKMFELDQSQKGFPTMRILGSEASRRISSLIADDTLRGALSTLSLAVFPPSIREATRRFIIQKDVSAQDHQLIRSHCSGTTLWSGILLLRGLLVDGEGILGYVLKERRWRVDYGLDPKRTLLAVPYRAKDVPSLRAEFGHPDVAIALTCLSYYYGGLTKPLVLQCFDLLTKLDNPDMEYDQWIEFGEGIPTSLRQVNGVNTNDDIQVEEHLVPLFSKNTKTIDFYLSQVVFPQAAKEFQFKLTTSAWDLVEDKSNVTTGFSGTNDNQYLLPTSITQEDPVCQLSTNALVLQYLLQPENNHYECTEGINGERESAKAFLRRLIRHEPEIRVLLDVGAQMLELQNEELARQWLSFTPHVSAAIFFNDSDHLTVLSQDGTTEPLISSPFSRQLDKCIVYLDDAHTRGTDLKLPRGTRAAVTLGPKVTKDRLLQGCMRMRQLGKGQSVMFFAPGEVDRRIRGLIPKGKESENGVRVIDILRWAMRETCWDIAHHLPHWAQQGVDHHRRFSAYKQYDSTEELDILKNSWLQNESQTLEDMYEPTLNAQGAGLRPEINSIPSLRDRLKHLGITQLIDVRMAEEQEREVNHEVERERHVERPLRMEPAKHSIHDDIRKLVHTGSLPVSYTGIVPLFSQTGIDIGAWYSMEEWYPPALATKDFAITTRESTDMPLNSYLRPVNWVLSFESGSFIVVISPYEANELLPIIRKSKKVQLHVYAPRVTASMRSFSDLTFYSIPKPPSREWTCPRHLQIQLNLFAGQLYFDSREEYERVCVLLALHMAHPGAKHIEVDGFVPPAYRTGERSPFSASVISMFKELMSLRRKGMGFGGTDIGRVLDARRLNSEFESWVREE